MACVAMSVDPFGDGLAAEDSTGLTSLTESPIWPRGAVTRMAVSRSRLLGRNMALLTWFITT